MRHRPASPIRLMQIHVLRVGAALPGHLARHQIRAGIVAVAGPGQMTRPGNRRCEWIGLWGRGRTCFESDDPATRPRPALLPIAPRRPRVGGSPHIPSDPGQSGGQIGRAAQNSQGSETTEDSELGDLFYLRLTIGNSCRTVSAVRAHPPPRMDRRYGRSRESSATMDPDELPQSDNGR